MSTLQEEMEVVRELGRELSNWGRWGVDDERGTLNHITPEKLIDAAASVTSGRVISLALPLDKNGPADGSFRRNILHVMTQTGTLTSTSDLGGGAGYADDCAVLYLQGSTQWDALSHFQYDGLIYGDRPAASVTTEGASFCDIASAASGYVSRGVLLDIARLIGVERLPEGFSITTDHLDQALERQGVDVTPGDILLVRTGVLGDCLRRKTWDALRRPQPGLHYPTLRWLHERMLAAVATDTTRVEAHGQLEHVSNPLHMVALRDMGLHLGELWDLELLAEACAGDGRWDFFLSAVGLPVVGGVGTPVNPVAIK